MAGFLERTCGKPKRVIKQMGDYRDYPYSQSEPEVHPQPEPKVRIRITDAQPFLSAVMALRQRVDQEQKLRDLIDPPALRELRRQEELRNLIDPPALRELRRLERLHKNF